MGLVTVIVPAYQPVLSADEELSFRRTLNLLGRYSITLVCPNDLVLSEFESIANEYKILLRVERFKNSFFQGIEGYNRLLLSKEFYLRFSIFDYILICQLDAFIFQDELDYWCKQGYDYIGAPLIGQFSDTVFSEKMRVGNGGLSLRKVSTYLSFFQSNRTVFSPRQLAQYIALLKKPYTRIWLWLLMMAGWRNKPSVVARRWKYNEDDFWSGLLDHSQYPLRKPIPQEAAQFSFERFPKELFEMNNHQLPFGCHAWRKYQYAEFWSQYINVDKQED